MFSLLAVVLYFSILLYLTSLHFRYLSVSVSQLRIGAALLPAAAVSFHSIPAVHSVPFHVPLVALLLKPYFHFLQNRLERVTVKQSQQHQHQHNDANTHTG